MRCVSVRRTNLPIAGPGKARVLGPSTINAPNQPICSARYAPSAEPALPSCCPLATPRPCSSISTKSQRKSPPAHTPFSFSIKLDGTAPKTSRLPKTSRSCRCRRVRQELNPQKNLAVYAGELAVEPHLQILRRNRRPPLRLERAHRSALENHVHRSPRLGSRRSLIVRIGIRSSQPSTTIVPPLHSAVSNLIRTPSSRSDIRDTDGETHSGALAPQRKYRHSSP